jgi:hypothetical protein
MPRGLYGGMQTPCLMSRTTIPRVQALHGSWTVQQYAYPMHHGLYGATKGIDFPWVMDCTVQLNVFIPHAPWGVQSN